MNKTESYSLLFTDSLIGNLAINPSSEFIIYSMKMFATYNAAIMFIIVLCASFASITLNYFFGKILKKIFDNSVATKLNANQKTAEGIFNKYYILFLILSVVPICGKFIQLAAGVFNVRYARVITICMLLKAIYYLVVLLF